MDNLLLIDSKNIPVGDVPKGEKFGSQGRKKLSDISNLQERPKPTNQDPKKSITLGTKEYIDKLQKDNAELTKHLADRNKLIELSVMELRKLRLNLQTVQQQNLQLAQANSQMLSELNTGKDRLRVLQHDLGCANGLLKARKLEAAERRKRVAASRKANNEMCSGHYEELVKSSQAGNMDELTENQRRQSRKQSFGRLPVKTVHADEEANKKRRCSRRQSARLKVKESEATEDAFEVDGAEFPVCSSLHDESGKASAKLSTEKEDEGNADPKSEDLDIPAKEDHPEKTDKKRRSRRQSASIKITEAEATDDLLDIDDAKFQATTPGENGQAKLGSQVKVEDCENASHGSDSLNPRRSSVGRPLRRAAEKIQSYKERSLNTKMRREE